MIIKNKGRNYDVEKSKPIGPSKHMVYVGIRKELQGKTAIVAAALTWGVCARFDDVDTGLGLGWWSFPETDFIDEGTFNKEFSRQKKEHNYSHNHAMRKTIERFIK